MVACDGRGCLIEWFHFECVGLSEEVWCKVYNFVIGHNVNLFLCLLLLAAK